MQSGPDISTCAGLSAIEHANSKFSKGYLTTSVVCTTCCHEFVLPEGAGQLQKGERFVFSPYHPCVLCSNPIRYANIDYVVVQSTCHNLKPKKVASYDIMYQWSKNLCKHLQGSPLNDAEQLDDKIVVRMVPKFHLAAHCQECRADFSLNYEPGARRKDMEGPKQTWFGLQGGGSTKDQGPGFWSDVMDDKFRHWNWSKFIGLGTCPPHQLSSE